MVQSDCSSLKQVCKVQFSNKQILLFHFVIYLLSEITSCENAKYSAWPLSHRNLLQNLSLSKSFKKVVLYKPNYRKKQEKEIVLLLIIS